MSGRHAQSAIGGPVRIWLAGLGIALVATLIALFVVPSGSAGAAPKASYTAGSDTATFTVTGVLDHNCLVSTGGTEIWIKPGDDIKFNSSLAGISVGDAVAGQTLGGLLNSLLQPSQVAGLDVTAQIYTGKTAQTLTVSGGKTTTFPSSTQQALSAGDHKVTWQATGLALLPGLTKSSIPLSSSALKSGTELSWTGVIHVTKNAPQCKLTVGTPQTKISVGPVHVSVPPMNVSVPGVTLPTSLPSVSDLNPSSAAPTTAAGTRSTASAAPAYKPPALSVPQKVVPAGDGSDGSDGGAGGNGGFRLGLTTNGSNGQLAAGSSTTGDSSASASSGAQSGDGSNSSSPVDLASSSSAPSGQLPVLLAILAVITLAMVAGIYARLYLLGRKSSAAG